MHSPTAPRPPSLQLSTGAKGSILTAMTQPAQAQSQGWPCLPRLKDFCVTTLPLHSSQVSPMEGCRSTQAEDWDTGWPKEAGTTCNSQELQWECRRSGRKRVDLFSPVARDRLLLKVEVPSKCCGERLTRVTTSCMKSPAFCPGRARDPEGRRGHRWGHVGSTLSISAVNVCGRELAKASVVTQRVFRLRTRAALTPTARPGPGGPPSTQA